MRFIRHAINCCMFVSYNFRTENEEDIKGVPDFWLTIFKNVSTLSEMVQEHDEPILKHLHDIKVKFLPSNPMVSYETKYNDIINNWKGESWFIN